MKRPLDVEIMGHRLTVASDEGDEHVRKVAAYVDERMREIAVARPETSTLQVALVAALNIASEYWKLRQAHEDVERTISRLSQRVRARLDR